MNRRKWLYAGLAAMGAALVGAVEALAFLAGGEGDKTIDEARVNAIRLSPAVTPSAPGAALVTPTNTAAGPAPPSPRPASVAPTPMPPRPTPTPVPPAPAPSPSPPPALPPTDAPSGRIAFVSDRDGPGNWEIYVMNVDGTEQTRLTNNPTVGQSPSWSPDGSRIAFTSDRNGVDDIYVMNADGTGQTRLTSNPTSDRSAAWSPR